MEYKFILDDMLRVKDILPKDEEYYEHIFDFAEEGTIWRANRWDQEAFLSDLLTRPSFWCITMLLCLSLIR